MFVTSSAALALGALALAFCACIQEPAPRSPEPTAGAASSKPLRVLIVDGRNNHAWRATTPVLRAILTRAGCSVEVATAPEGEAGLASFRPSFAQYQVVLSNYNGPTWSAETRRDLEAFVGGGGGLVVVHAADNAFPEWREWNEMIGVGGWGNRDEKSGPYLRLREGRWVADPTPGPGGSHGAQHEFVLTHHASEHPILRGLPQRWKHAQDELYDRLRGPAQNVTVLASAFAPKERGGSGEEEPLLFALTWKKGRIFHSALGHSVIAMQCAGFQETLVRGVEWAATGAVRERATPSDFPSEEKVSLRELEPSQGEVKK
jgi:type 1 glutamine amidotransferase